MLSVILQHSYMKVVCGLFVLVVFLVCSYTYFSVSPMVYLEEGARSDRGPGVKFKLYFDSAVKKWNQNHTKSGSLHTGFLDWSSVQWLEGFRTPCWHQDDTCGWSYDNNEYWTPKTDKGFTAMMGAIKKRKKHGQNTLHCIPSVYLVGQPKCGTTDLYNVLLTHPHIRGGVLKESHWWSRRRFGRGRKPVPFQDYVQLFDGAANAIESQNDTSFPFLDEKSLLVDGSASSLWDTDNWDELVENEGRIEPRYLLPHYLHNVHPATKVVAILRNPVDRLYSDYLYFHKETRKAQEDFHRKAEAATRVFAECLESHTERQCIHNRTLHNKMGHVRLRVGMYYNYLSEWMQVFPREQVYVLRMEDYGEDREAEMDQLFHFLGVDPLPKAVAADINEKPHANSRPKSQNIGKMLDKTRLLLTEFYSTFNEQLAKLLDDEKYLWKKGDK